MRYIFTLGFLFVTVSALPGTASAKGADCWEKTGEVKLRACTKIIKSKRYLGKRISKKHLAIIYYNRGIAYKNKGQYDRAISDYDQAIKLNPKYATAYYNRGWTYKNKGERDKAIADYRKALEINPSHKKARGNLTVLGVEP
jgi:tetratricopeptide (TPR) repeat protein